MTPSTDPAEGTRHTPRPLTSTERNPVYNLWLLIFVAAAASSILDLDVARYLWNAWCFVTGVMILTVAASLL